MKLSDRLLALLGLRRDAGPERDVLARLARATVSPDDYLASLEHAVTIAQAGGMEDRTLCALIHLGATRMLTPETERVLREAGIDTRPWAQIREAAQPGKFQGEAPMGYELIPPEGRCVSPDGHDSSVEDKTNASLIPNAVICSGCGRLWTIVVLPMEGA